MGASKNIQNVRQVDATNSDNRQAIDSSGRSAIQNPPNLDAAISTLATETKLEAVRALVASLDAKDFATQTTLASILADTAGIETILTAIRDTAGVKKITDPLPAGTNIIGGTRLYDHNGNALSVQDGVALPAGNDHLLVGGVHDTDGKTYHARMIDDTDTAALKRILVEAAIKPGSSISTTTTPGSLQDAVRDFCKNGGSREMNVDGSGTPVEFTFNADATKDIKLTEVRFVFNAASIVMNTEDFGSDIALSNGVKFEVTQNAVTTELANFLINEDFLALPARGGINLIYDGPANDQVVASFFFGGAVTLKGGTGDKIKITVRDDITFGSAHKVKLFWAVVYGVKDQ